MKFYQLNGEQKIDAIAKIAAINKDENILQVFSEEAIIKEIEQGMDIDQNFSFEEINDDEVIVSIKPFA